MTNNAMDFLNFVLPEGALEWFDIVESSKTDEELRAVLEEKNLPPLLPEDEGKKITSKGFTNITVTDFPIRGHRTRLTFRRRYWQVEGEKKLLKRDIKLTAEGTELEKEFAAFLKERGGEERRLFDKYCQD